MAWGCGCGVMEVRYGVRRLGGPVRPGRYEACSDARPVGGLGSPRACGQCEAWGHREAWRGCEARGRPGTGCVL